MFDTEAPRKTSDKLRGCPSCLGSTLCHRSKAAGVHYYRRCNDKKPSCQEQWSQPRGGIGVEDLLFGEERGPHIKFRVHCRR
jgi:hypothetical protein